MKAEKTFDWLRLCLDFVLEYFPQNIKSIDDHYKFLDFSEHFSTVLRHAVNKPGYYVCQETVQQNMVNVLKQEVTFLKKWNENLEN
ncbi:MAG: hypothetical protein LBC86_03660 [Oscillospiraceae bacterium]|jgi:hypothetical protein|nr:hypothetical protein [Oscillospiraceae bacterium]